MYGFKVLMQLGSVMMSRIIQCLARPTFHHPWESWSYLLLDTAAGWSLLPFKVGLAHTLGKDDPPLSISLYLTWAAQ